MTLNIAIIGAGMAGLTAAHALKDHADVSLFDKSRGVAGRMSTRYAGEYEFDHGAQYFTARDPRFQAAVETAIEQGVVAPWQGRAFYKKESGLVADTGGDRFVGAPRMNSWSKVLAEGLNITLGARVAELIREDDKWSLRFQDDTIQSGFDAVICAVPSVQAEALLPSDFSAMDKIRATKMDACFALMVGFDSVHDFGWDSLRVDDGVNAWLAVNSDKPGRAKAKTTLMVHAAPEWSNTHSDANRKWIETKIVASATKFCGFNIEAASHIALHRWLYASVSVSPQQACLFDQGNGLAACGDWCLGGRVEGAYLSGLAAAEAVKPAL